MIYAFGLAIALVLGWALGLWMRPLLGQVRYGDINNQRQNHPELIVRDLAPWVRPEVVRRVLRYRGVHKWLRVRRLLIALKHRWKVQAQEIQAHRLTFHRRRSAPAEYERGYEEALVDCRQQVRALCHSPRDVVWPEVPWRWPEACRLPADFPTRPHKRWFVGRDSAGRLIHPTLPPPLLVRERIVGGGMFRPGDKGYDR